MLENKVIEISVKIIASAGAAKSSFMEALSYSKNKKYDSAESHIDEGNKYLMEAYEYHSNLLAESAQEKFEINPLYVHAEDIMMSAETIKILVNELMEIYRILGENTKEDI